jgi:hypothetical protein
MDGTDLQNNLQISNPLFADAANGDFRLRAGASAIDEGRPISGITDGFVGSAPDISAYEVGRTWTAGANIRLSGIPTPSPSPSSCAQYKAGSQIPIGFGVP